MAKYTLDQMHKCYTATQPWTSSWRSSSRSRAPHWSSSTSLRPRSDARRCVARWGNRQRFPLRPAWLGSWRSSARTLRSGTSEGSAGCGWLWNWHRCWRRLRSAWWCDKRAGDPNWGAECASWSWSGALRRPLFRRVRSLRLLAAIFRVVTNGESTSSTFM